MRLAYRIGAGLGLATLALLAVFVGVRAGSSTPPASPTPSAYPSPVSTSSPSATAHLSPNGGKPPSPPLVAWHGPVEQIFVHPLVLRPRLAFTDDALGQGFADYFVTAREFRGILDELWRNGWTLVDIHRAATGQVRVPAGRKPLVLIEDDVNYYDYFRGRGLATTLALDDSGAVVAVTPNGRLTQRDVVPLVEAEIARHPEFSADGARGVLAVTAYEGLLGEHRLERADDRERVRVLAARLRATGWTFASHTWGHIDLTTAGAAWIAEDTRKWRAIAAPLLGPVDVLVYPFGARPPQAGVRQLAAAGFTIQEDIDIVARRVVRGGVVVMSRRHIDGFAFEAVRRQRPFFDVEKIRDPARPR